MKVSLVALLILALGTAGWAQREESSDDQDDRDQDIEQGVLDQLQTDRPILIRASDIENHDAQIEFDVKVSRDRDGSPMKVSAPVLYRLDTGPRTEFRVQSDFLTYQNPNLGFSDVSVGFKWNFIKGDDNFSVVGSLEIPSGSAGFADPGWEPSAIFIYERQLGKRWNLGLNGGVAFNRDSATLDYYAVGLGAAQLGYNLTPTTSLTTALIVKTPDAYAGGITRVSGALGISHALSDHTRITLTTGRSFSSTGDDYLFIFGLSRRI